MANAYANWLRNMRIPAYSSRRVTLLLVTDNISFDAYVTDIRRLVSPPPSQQSAHFQRWYQRACRNNFSTRIKAEDLFGIRSANRVALPVAITKTHYHRSSITRESCTLLFFNYRPLTLLAPGHQRVIPIPSWEWLLKTLVSLWERFFRFSFSFASILEYF